MPKIKEKKFKLPKKVKAKWIKALRGGRYKQGKGELVKKNILTDKPEYCCLGVAKRIGLCKNHPDHSNKNIHVDEAFIPLDIQGTLAIMNDGSFDQFKRPRSFVQIANWIEKNL